VARTAGPGVCPYTPLFRSEGEAGRAERLRGRFDEWTRRGEPFGTFRYLVALAYLSVGPGGADATGLVAQADAHLEPGWFRDRLVDRKSTRLNSRHGSSSYA